MVIFSEKIRQGVVFILAFVLLFNMNIQIAVAEDMGVQVSMVRDASTLENGDLLQRFQLIGSLNPNGTSPNEVGIVYSDIVQNPQVGGNDVMKVTSALSSGAQIIAQTQGLEDETTYYARLYAIYGAQTVYSPVMTYTTAIKVQPGRQIGCENIVSGGQYRIDNATFDRASSYLAIIKSGYTAEYAGNTFDGNTNTGVITFIKEDNHSVITTDKVTHKRYLHVFDLKLGKRPVAVTLDSVSDASTVGGLQKINALMVYKFNQENNIQETGVLYGTNYELIIGNEGVHKATGETFPGENDLHKLCLVDGVTLGSDTYYVRAYVKSDGKYYYGDDIRPVTSSSEHGIELGANIPIDIGFGITQEYSFTLPPNCSAKIGSRNYSAGQSVRLDVDGKYFILITWSDGTKGIKYVEVDRTPQLIPNLINFGVYNSYVQPSCEEFNTVYYLSQDGGPENEFASGIKISEIGDYSLKVIDATNNVIVYNFHIRSPFVETLEVFSVSVHSAEVSANFSNNGTVLERGFVYSAINALPVIGGMGCTAFVPQTDPNPGFLTVTLTGLALNSPYFYRAYIKSGDAGNPTITYGGIKEFHTEAPGGASVVIDHPTDIMTRSITLQATVMDNNGSPVSSRGVVYATTQNPAVGAPGCQTVQAAAGGTGTYTVTITGLSPGVNYFIRAYAVNDNGIGDSGYDFVLSTLTSAQQPTVALSSIENITKVKADIACSVTAHGGGAITEQGILYSTTADPTLEKVQQGLATKVTAPLSSNSFTLQASGLTAGTTYYAKGYAVNEAGTAYTDEDDFTTVADINVLTMAINPSTPTTGNVRVTLTFPDFAQQKKYKIGDGEYKDYTGTIILTGNTKGYVKYTDGSGTWSAEKEFEVTNIDRTKPTWPLFSVTRPSLAASSLQMVIKPGADSGSGVPNQSGVDYVEVKLGLSGTWEKYTAGNQGIAIEQGIQVSARTVDKAGNFSDEHIVKNEIRNVALTTKDDQTTVNRGIFIEERQKNSTETVKTIALKESIQADDSDQYVSYSSGTSYKGCGVKAAQIYSSWFGYNLTQNETKDYVETTNFSAFLDIASFGVTWLFDLVDPYIFSTPAEVDSGLQDILDEKFNGYIVERHSPNTKGGAIAIIESSLAHGYPVIMLVDDGYHWQVISQSNVTRNEDGDVVDADFLVHDNKGQRVRSWSDLDYYFEDNFWAEAARYADYDSYKDTIMTIRYEETPYLDNWSSGWSSAKVFSGQDEQGKPSQYLFLLKNDSGLVHINKVHDNGTIGPVVATYNWSSGWDNISMYEENGTTYLVLVKSGNGKINIRKMNADGTVGELTDDSDMGSAISNGHIDLKQAQTVNVNGKSYLLAHKKNAAAKFFTTLLYALEPGGKMGSSVSYIYTRYTGNSDDAWDSTAVYETGGNAYLLLANSESGEVEIHAVDANGQIQENELFSYAWSAGWTKFHPFTVNGNTFLMIAKSGIQGVPFGTADPDGMVRFHRIKEDGTIGDMTDDAYWDTISPFLPPGDFAYDVTDFYQAGPYDWEYLLALRSYDGMVKTLRLYEQNGQVRIKSNLNY